MGPRAGWLLSVLAVTSSVMAGSAEQQPATILDLQPLRQTQSIHISSRSEREGVATIVNLNPSINAWFLIEVSWTGGEPKRVYHIENPAPHDQTLLLDERYPSGLMIAGAAPRYACDLFSAGPPDQLEQARGSRGIFSPLCESRLYLRNPTTGHRTNLEAVTEFFRNRIWGGETMIGLGHQVMGDTNRQTGTLTADARSAAAARTDQPGPQSARVDPKFADRVVAAPSLGIGVIGPAGSSMALGAWYPTGTPGSYVSVFQPSVIAPDVLESGKAAPLDSVEASALSYLIAFDLDRFDLGYARGTTYPEVGWSAHIPTRVKNEQLAGPDGIGDTAPLVATGMVPPNEIGRTLAVFTGGFKRAHGAFLYGDLSLVNHGSHYGFIENGVIFSRLQPGLATIFVRDDGRVEMKTWATSDNTLLPRIRHARQSGVPLVEVDPASHAPVPGPLVTAWGAGNWSGSQDRKLRTMRSGVALCTAGGKRYLIYAVFSSATPSAMARVFQAYRCEYAMLLDMNALEHTYLAFYRVNGQALAVEYLMTGMREVDTNVSSVNSPAVRFIGYPDNRDFFYVMRRQDRPGP